jgi:hypothetical protein
MLILLATNNTYGAINKGQFFGNASDIIIVIPIAEARAKPMETLLRLQVY